MANLHQYETVNSVLTKKFSDLLKFILQAHSRLRIHTALSAPFISFTRLPARVTISSGLLTHLNTPGNACYMPYLPAQTLSHFLVPP